MLSTVSVIQPTDNHPPDVIEILSSMCQAVQPEVPQPVARWILEDGQLLGVVVASFSSPICRNISNYS